MKSTIAAIALLFLGIVALASFTTPPAISPRIWVAKRTWALRAGAYSIGVTRCVPEMAVQAQLPIDEQVRLRRTFHIRLGPWGTYVQPRSVTALLSISAFGCLAFATFTLYVFYRSRTKEPSYEPYPSDAAENTAGPQTAMIKR